MFNKLFDAGVVILIVIVVIAIGGMTAHKLSDKKHHTEKEEFVGHDDVVEEVLEEMHSIISGQEKQDFTPESPEK